MTVYFCNVQQVCRIKKNIMTIYRVCFLFLLCSLMLKLIGQRAVLVQMVYLCRDFKMCMKVDDVG